MCKCAVCVKLTIYNVCAGGETYCLYTLCVGETRFKCAASMNVQAKCGQLCQEGDQLVPCPPMTSNFTLKRCGRFYAHFLVPIQSIKTPMDGFPVVTDRVWGRDLKDSMQCAT